LVSFCLAPTRDRDVYYMLTQPAFDFRDCGQLAKQTVGRALADGYEPRARLPKV